MQTWDGMRKGPNLSIRSWIHILGCLYLFIAFGVLRLYLQTAENWLSTKTVKMPVFQAVNCLDLLDYISKLD